MAVNQLSPVLESRNRASVHVGIDIFSFDDYLYLYIYLYTYIHVYICIYIYTYFEEAKNGQMYLESPGFKYPVAMRITSTSVQIPRPPKLNSLPTPSCQLPK